MDKFTKTTKLKSKIKNQFSVEGMNFDFVAMNLTGFLFYSIYNTYGYFVDDDQTGKVDLNDIFFSYHALFATFVTISQICIYPRGRNRIHSYTVALLVFMWISAGIYSTLTLVIPS
jgi:cystinosin